MRHNSSPGDALKNKVAVVTGGSSGIGLATAEKLASEGAFVYMLARGKEKLYHAVQSLINKNYSVFPAVCDVSCEESVKKTITSILERHGRIDILVNNAGVGYIADVENTTADQFDETIGTNLRGTFLMTKYTLPVMKKARDGYIINVSSGAGLNGIASMSIYCASKFGVRGFTEAVALEAKPFDVRVSVICPGTVNTNLHEKFGLTHSEEACALMIQPEDIAETICSLATSPKRYWIFEIRTRAFMLGRKT